MSSRKSFLNANNYQLLTISELKQWATERDRPTTQQRLAYVLVYSYRTQIFKSGTFLLILSVLGELLDRISVLLEPTSHELSFVLVSWRIENLPLVVSTTHFGSQLRFHREGDTVRVALRDGGYEKIIDSINSSVRWVRRKTGQPPLSKLKRTVKGLRANPETKTIAYQTINCIPTGCTTSNFTKKVFNRTYASVRTPGYMALKKKGQLPPHTYSLNLVDVEPGFFTSSKVWTGQPHFVEFESTANSNLLETDIASGHLGVDENLLIAKLAGKINKSRGNLAESLVQGNLTVRLIKDNIVRLGTFVSLLNGGSPKAISKFLGSTRSSRTFAGVVSKLRRSGLSGTKLLAQIWLEARYGWMPLIQDIDNSMGALKSLSLKDPGILSVTASRRSTTNVVRKVVYATNPDTSPRTRYYYEKRSTVCKIGVRYKLDSNLVLAISGLGLTSPVSLFWELAPFSFVVDWFLPIGPALEAFSAFEGLTFMSGYKTYFTKADSFLNVSENYTHTDPNPLNSYVLKDRGNCYGKRIIMGRSVLTNFPGPRLPMLKSPFSFIHAANAAALVAKALIR